MNITLAATKAELLQLLSKATNSTITDFVVLKGPKTSDILTPILVKMANIMNCAFVDPNTLCPPSQKIAYIKALREAVSVGSTITMGLAEAKWAVENWIAYTTFVRETGRLPKISFDGGWNSTPTLS